jgi:hypothetical protein
VSDSSSTPRTSAGPDDRRWDRLARQLPFDELGFLRAQADGWRNGIAAATTILLSVAVVKGRGDVAGLPAAWRTLIALLTVVAFAALVGALVVTLRVSQGMPGQQIWNTGEELRDWTGREVRRGGRMLRRAGHLAVGGLFFLVLASAAGWLAPNAPAAQPGPVTVRTAGGAVVCGRLDSIRAAVLTVRTGSGAAAGTWTSPIGEVTEVVPVEGC